MEDLMKRHERTFGCKKPIIGCLHLRALPGSPRWDSSFSIQEHIDLMSEQARILMDLGYDAAVFANEADIPYVQSVSPAVIATYTRIVTEVKKELTIPFGIGVLLDRLQHFPLPAPPEPPSAEERSPSMLYQTMEL